MNFLLHLKLYQHFKNHHAEKLHNSYLLNICFALEKVLYHIVLFLCHLLSFGSSGGLNCKLIRRKYGFSIDLKISVMSSGDKPILTLKISFSNFFRFQYFADFGIKIVLLGQNSFE